MKLEAFTVVEGDLQQEIPLVRAMIKTLALHQLMISMATGPYGLSPAHLTVLSILETAGAQVMELEKRVRNRIVSDREVAGFSFRPALDPVDAAFSSLFAVYAAAEAAAAACVGIGQNEVQVRGGFAQPWVQQIRSQSGREIVQSMIGELCGFYDHHHKHADIQRRIEKPEDFISCTGAFFQLLANGVKEIACDAEFERHIRALEGMTIEICGRGYHGLAPATTAEDEEPGDLLPIAPEDVVGNRDYLQAGLRLARDVAGFDLASGQNPKRLNPVLFGQGSPGCGKTITAHAIGNYFLRYCRQRGIPARFVVIRRTDWASSFQNASANQLVTIFKEQVQGFRGVVGVYWPDIDTAFAARSDPGLRSEEANILGASFGIFDGTLIPKNGKWFLICDANYMNMDEATLSRITQDPYKIYGPQTPEDYVELMREKKLSDFRELLELTDQEWLQLGRSCIEMDFSGRNVDSICQKVLTEIQDVEPPDHYYAATLEERKKILRGLSRPTTYPRLLEIMDGYKKFEKAALEQAEQERFRSRVQEIVLNLSAQRAAMDALGGKA